MEESGRERKCKGSESNGVAVSCCGKEMKREAELCNGMVRHGGDVSSYATEEISYATEERRSELR